MIKVKVFGFTNLVI